MTRYKSRHSIWLKIISTVVLCLFSVNTVLWAYPDSKSADSNTLRPQSIFQPLRDSGIQDSAELAFEILTGIRLLHAGKTYSAVNGILTETYKNSHDKRKIEFLPGTERTNGQTIAKFKVIGQEDVVFEIKYHGTKNDVIEITKIVSTPKTSSNLSKNRTLRGQEYKFLYEIRENPEKFGALSLAYSQLKFGRTVETREFSSQLAEAISADMGNELDRNREDWIVVSPGGYGVPNAAYNLAKNVAGQLSLPHISLAAPITKNRDLQNKLASVARGKDWRLLVHNRKGMKENFSLNGKKVIFIDDSILSGTILDSDSDYLLKAGVVRLQPYILAKLIPKENRNFERVVDLQILKRIGPRALVSIFNDPESIYTTRLVYYTFQLDDREFNRLIDLLTPTARLNLYLYSIEYFDAKSPAKIYRLIKLIENDLKVKLPGSQEFNNMHQNIFYETVIKMIRGYGYHVPCEAAATVSKKLWHYLNIYANKPSAKVVLFDLDKTLSFSSAYYDAVKQATLDFLLSRFGIAAEETQTRIDNLRENLKRKNLPMQQSDIAHEFGVDFQTFDEEIVKRIDSSKYIKPDLELIQLLQELKDAGISLGILSNSGSSQTRRILSSLGVLHLFDNVLTADVAGDFKPDKKFFYSALSRFGVKPQEAVMVGDSYEMDIKPASEIGMKTLNIHSVEDLFDIWHIVFQSADTTLSDSALSDFRVSLQSMAAEQDLTMFEKALSQYDLGEIIDVKILRHSEYRNGIKVLSVETEKGRYVLRKYPFVLAEEQLNKMGQQRQYLRQNDFPILLIDEVKTRDGQKHAIVGDYSYILYSAAGRNLRQEEKTIDESIGKAAQTLAYYHNSAGSLNISSKRVSGNYSIPFEDLPCLRNNLHDFAGKISCMDNSYRMTRARTLFIDSIYQRALETQIERLIAELPPSLYGRLKKIAIHGDFNTKNILVDDRGDPIALIDFDDAMMESRLKDIVHNFFAWLYSYQTELKRPLTSQDIMRFMHDFLETYILALDNANVLSSDEILALRAYLRGSLIYEIFYRVDLLTHQDPEDYFNSDKGDSRFFEEMSRAMDYLLLLDGLNFQELEESLNKTLKAKIRIREALESFSKDGKDVLLVPEDIVLTKAAVDKELDLMFLRKAYHLQIDLIIQRKLQQAIKLEADADKLIPSDPAKASMYLNSTKNALERISVASGFEKKYIDEYARINRKIEALSFSNYSLKPRDRRDHIILIPTKDRSISLQRLLQSAYDELKIFNFGKYDQ
ncbi:MAG: phosphoribosyltransferase family protein, partial [Candidatus Omnitrophota bacterium]|nr:phosphoribosyltransferase family protein [Candidatus Omnitrophota bacterium]